YAYQEFGFPAGAGAPADSKAGATVLGKSGTYDAEKGQTIHKREAKLAITKGEPAPPLAKTPAREQSTDGLPTPQKSINELGDKPTVGDETAKDQVKQSELGASPATDKLGSSPS